MKIKELVPTLDKTPIILFDDPISISSYGSVYFSEWKSIRCATKISTVKDFIEKEISFYLFFNNKGSSSSSSFIPKLYSHGEAKLYNHRGRNGLDAETKEEKQQKQEETNNNRNSETETVYYYLTMQRLGPSIDCLHDDYLHGFSKKTFYWFAAESLKLIRDIHNAGILHRDIKPDNFAVDAHFKNTLYIFDFGLSCYDCSIHKNNEINSPKSLIGTLRYASKNSHNTWRNNKQSFPVSRKDDLESYLYMMMYLYHNNLPWIIHENTTIEEACLNKPESQYEISDKQFLKQYINDKIYHSKMNDVDYLLESMGPLWSTLSNEIDTLESNATIDYNEWISFFENYYSTNSYDGHFLDWNVQVGKNEMHEIHEISSINVSSKKKKKSKCCSYRAQNLPKHKEATNKR